MLKQRILTGGLLGLITVLVTVYLPHWLFMTILYGFFIAAAWEWAGLTEWGAYPPRIVYLGILNIFLLLGPIFIDKAFWIILGNYLWILIFIVLLIIRIFPQAAPRFIPLKGLLGWILLTACWCALSYLKTQPYHLLALFALVWSIDTVSYIGGCLFGRHKLAPMISPNKTIEGSIIGLSFVLIGTVLVHFLTQSYSLKDGLIFALLIGIAAIVGDLFESLMKRQAGLKDSGQLLPGHGGLLDRIDSLLAAAPIFAWAVLKGFL